FFALTATGLGYAWFGFVGKARGEVREARDLLDSRKPMADYSDALEAEKKEYTARFDHVETFGNSRVLWTQKLEQLAARNEAPPEENRHMIWLTELKMKMSGDRDTGLKLHGYSGTDEVSKLSNFHRDLATGAFFADFESITNPAGDKRRDEAFEPADAFEFEM